MKREPDIRIKIAFYSHKLTAVKNMIKLLWTLIFDFVSIKLCYPP